MHILLCSLKLLINHLFKQGIGVCQIDKMKICYS